MKFRATLASALFSAESPIAYLTRWRMFVATRMLVGGEGSVAEIARRVGYQSEAAFAKAFKRVVGIGPGGYRRRAEANT